MKPWKGWKGMRAAPDASKRLIAVIPNGKGEARRHIVPAAAAEKLARHIVCGNAARGATVRAYVYDEKGEQLAAF